MNLSERTEVLDDVRSNLLKWVASKNYQYYANAMDILEENMDRAEDDDSGEEDND